MNLMDETRSCASGCGSKPLFSGKGSCLDFPTLTQKFTLALASHKPAKYVGENSKPLKWKNG